MVEAATIGRFLYGYSICFSKTMQNSELKKVRIGKNNSFKVWVFFIWYWANLDPNLA